MSEKGPVRKVMRKIVFSGLYALIILLPYSLSSAASLNEDEKIITVKDISFPLLVMSLIILLLVVLLLLKYRRVLAGSNQRMQNEIIDRKLAQEALRESEERYALAARGANDGLWDWNVKSGAVYFSSRWKSMIGYGEDEIGTDPDEWLKRVYSDDVASLRNNIATHFEGITNHFECEYRLRHKDGSYLWMLSRGLAVKDGEGNVVRIAGSQTDITARKKAEEQLIYDAFHDALTGLPNRALFIDHLEVSIARRKRNEDYKFAVLFLDIDRFKNINDGFGHLFGNQVLADVAKRLKTVLRLGDTFARFGGDEFAILLDDIMDVNQANVVSERINRELSTPLNVNGKEIFITISIGIALSDQYNRSEDILRDADIAMFKAKYSGRGCYLIFNETMRNEVMNLLQLETELRNAFKNREFIVYYQPIVSLETARIVGFEALLRWHHPKRGFVPPKEFIPLAEENGLIVPIGNWVLREACSQINRWQHQFSLDPPLIISINISVRQLSQPNFIEQIRSTIEETGLNPQSLRLEITESCIAEDTKFKSIFRQLKEMDVQILIDDFGTGYSSLGYLQQFPVSALKIDRSFIKKIGAEGEDSEIVRAIVNLAHSLNMDVVAEGVEMTEHLPILKALKCKYAQGYLFSHPLNNRDIEDLLSSANTLSPDRVERH